MRQNATLGVHFSVEFSNVKTYKYLNARLNRTIGFLQNLQKHR